MGMYKDVDYYTLYKEKKNGRIYYGYHCYDENGRRCKRGTGASSRNAAMHVINSRIANGTLIYPNGMRRTRKGGKEEQIVARKTTASMTLSEFCKPLYVYESCPIVQGKLMRGGHYSKKLCTSNKYSINKHILPYLGSVSLSKLTYSTIDTWVLNLPKNAGISHNTANKMLSLLRSILNYAVKCNLIEKNPVAEIERLHPDSRIRESFTEDEVKKLFSVKWISPMAKSACYLSATTGMRLGEVRALQGYQIHEDYILVDASWDDTERKSTKSGKSRIVPLTKKAYAYLLPFMRNDHDYLFSLRDNIPVGDRYITDRLYEMLDSLGIERKGRSFHSFRHYVNTKLVAANINPEKIREAIGHSSSEMTEHYLHLKVEDMSEIRNVVSI